jgi:RNA polymerase sigma factor for flagellar operon FliA
MSLFSLEDLGFGSGEERLNVERSLEEGDADPLGALLTRERVDLVAAAIARLPERERMVITLYYHEELTMKEVGRVLGVNESRVSQIHSRAVDTLRRRLRRGLRPAPCQLSLR